MRTMVVFLMILTTFSAFGDSTDKYAAEIQAHCNGEPECVAAETVAFNRLKALGAEVTADKSDDYTRRVQGCAAAYYMRNPKAIGADFYRFTLACIEHHA